jgi:excisionase family DNA binding protein
MTPRPPRAARKAQESAAGPPRPQELRFERFGLPTAVLDVREAAAYLAVEAVTVYRLVRSGELPHTRVGRSVRFRVEDLDRYLAERTSRKWEPHGKPRGGGEG